MSKSLIALVSSGRVPRQYLSLAEKQGRVTRVGRGLYTVTGANVTENHSLAQASKRVPRGVVCLISAVRFQNLTTQSPFEVWMAIGIKARIPRIAHPRLHIVRFADKLLAFGVTEQITDGVPLKVSSPAKTVADCFKYRNKIGQDVALEALRDCYLQRKATLDQIWEAATVCRVAKVMRPFLESLS